MENRKKILLVENDGGSIIIMTRLLKGNGFSDLVVVKNEFDALIKINDQRQKFYLILMEVRIPLMDGFSLIGKIRQIPHYRDIPIITVTTQAMRGGREECLEAGATDFVAKPIDFNEFVNIVNYYISR